MLSSLASLLFLGTIHAAPNPALSPRLPGIEVMLVSAPTTLAHRFVAPRLSASGAYLLDTESGQEIFSLDPEVRRPMASLTKIMTALLIVEHHGLSQMVTVPPIAEQIHGSSIGLVPGQKLTVGSLLKALLLPSANDAAYALGVFHSRTVGAFVQEMNERALSLGLRHTQFANPAGLDNDAQYSSPRDLAWLAMAALKHQDLRTIVSLRTAQILASDGQTFDLKNTNEMLHYNEDVYGVKTGTTDAAGECLILLFTENNHTYLLVLLGSSERYSDSLRVMTAVRDAAL